MLPSPLLLTLLTDPLLWVCGVVSVHGVRIESASLANLALSFTSSSSLAIADPELDFDTLSGALRRVVQA
jgi:hypothetical protein